MATQAAPPDGPNTILRKFLMAVTGLLFLGFLVMHLAANFLLYISPDLYNEYSHKLISNPAIYLAEAVLVAIFVGHAWNGTRVWLANRRARPESYENRQYLAESTPASRTMIYTGALIAAFVVFHVWTMKFGAYVPNSDGTRDLYSLVIYKFAQPSYALAYVILMGALGLHLMHAGASALQTLGLRTPKWRRAALVASAAMGFFFFAAFSSFPIWFFTRQAHYRPHLEKVQRHLNAQQPLDPPRPEPSGSDHE